MSASFGANENTNPTPITMEGQHSVLAEPHLPGATIPTQDVTNPARPVDASYSSNPNSNNSQQVDMQREVLDKFPPPNKTHDDKIKASAGQFAADIKTTAKEVGANIKAGIQTAPAQLKDTWQKLTSKDTWQKLKDENFGNKGKVQNTGGEVKQQEQI